LHTAQDHLDVLAMALLALPKPLRDQPILVRADSAGATYTFTDELARPPTSWPAATWRFRSGSTATSASSLSGCAGRRGLHLARPVKRGCRTTE
jgi:hypothetical protein